MGIKFITPVEGQGEDTEQDHVMAKIEYKLDRGVHVGADPGNGHAGRNTGKLSFWTNPDRDAEERMTIDRDGNIGIGTNNPQANLHIELDPPSSSSDSNSTDFLQITSQFYSYRKESGGFKFQHSDTNRYTHILPKLRIYPVQTSGSQWSQTGITFKTTSSSNMNVGIGTDSPDSKLHILSTQPSGGSPAFISKSQENNNTVFFRI